MRIVNDGDKLKTVNAEQLSSKRVGTSSCPQLEVALKTWVLQKASNHAAINIPMLRMKAKALSAASDGVEKDKIDFSYGWACRFMKRCGLKSYVTHGEAGGADEVAIEEHLPRLQELIKQYSPEDVYNMDETGLFFRMSPSRTVAAMPTPGIHFNMHTFPNIS